MAGTFKEGFDNSETNVKLYDVYDLPLTEPPTAHFKNWHPACKNPECDRHACTASAEWCCNFCCPGCASGTGHTPDCDRLDPAMKAQAIPDAPVKFLFDRYPDHRANKAA